MKSSKVLVSNILNTPTSVRSIYASCWMPKPRNIERVSAGTLDYIIPTTRGLIPSVEYYTCCLFPRGLY